MIQGKCKKQKKVLKKSRYKCVECLKQHTFFDVDGKKNERNENRARCRGPLGDDARSRFVSVSMYPPSLNQNENSSRSATSVRE